MLWPFQKGVWIKLLLLYIFTGGMLNGPDVDFSRYSRLLDQKSDAESPADTSPEKQSQPEGFNVDSLPKLKTLVMEKGGQYWRENRRAILIVGSILTAAVFLLLLCFVWLSSRLSLTLLRCLDSGQVAVRSAWSNTAPLGESYFRFNFILTAVFFLTIIAVVGGAGFFVFEKPDALRVMKDNAIVLILLGSSVLVLAGFGAAVLWSFSHFLPVVMHNAQQKAGPALVKMFTWIRGHFWEALQMWFCYVVLSVSLVICVSIVVVMGGLILTAPLLLVALLGKGLDVLLGGAAKIAVFVVGGLLFACVFLIFAMIITVPTETFLTYLRMELINRLRPSSSPSPAS